MTTPVKPAAHTLNIVPEFRENARRALIAPKLAEALRDLMASCQNWAPTIDRSRARAALAEWDAQS